jgi:hypothetical protein
MKLFVVIESFGEAKKVTAYTTLKGVAKLVGMHQATMGKYFKNTDFVRLKEFEIYKTAVIKGTRNMGGDDEEGETAEN